MRRRLERRTAGTELHSNRTHDGNEDHADQLKRELATATTTPCSALLSSNPTVSSTTSPPPLFSRTEARPRDLACFAGHSCHADARVVRPLERRL